MKILIVSDTESKALWDFYEPGKLDEYDLILSCGDLDAEYLSFLATFTKVPVLYVHGNHDDSYAQKPPEGCICIEDMVYNYKGLRIVGLGGSLRYKPGIHQYTQREMKTRAHALRFRLWKNRGFDILLTHAPAEGYGDAEDMPHHGFSAFLSMMDRYRPRYMIHGHVHASYTRNMKRVLKYQDTQIINAYERYVLEIPDVSESPRKHRRHKKKAK